MSKSLALLTIAAFTLSAPLHARTLISVPAADPAIADRFAVVESPADAAAPPECSAGSGADAGVADATGAVADTGPTQVEAATTTCCWMYFNGRWWCIPCY